MKNNSKKHIGRVISSLITACMIALSASVMYIPAQAAAFTLNGVTYSTEPLNTVTVTNTADEAEIVIPAQVDYEETSYTVTKINLDNQINFPKNEVKKLTLPDTIESCQSVLGTYPSLETIVITGATEYVLPVENRAAYDSAKTILYKYAGSDTSFIVPDGVKTIYNRAFEGNETLTQITLPEGLETIGYNAFIDCPELTSVSLPDSVVSIGAYAFNYCTSLQTITLSPNSRLASIGTEAFQYCSQLTNITLPDSVTSVGNNAFSGTPLPAFFTQPENMTWDGAVPHKAVWDAVDGAAGYTVCLFKDGVYAGESIDVGTATSYNFTEKLKLATVGNYNFGVRVTPTDTTTYQKSITKLSAPIAVDSQLGNETDIKMTYIPGADGGVIYSLDIAWGDMVFTYNAGGPGEWNPDTLRYEGAAVAGWSVDTPDGDLITVTNHSNTQVRAGFDYSSTSGYETITSTFTGDRLQQRAVSLASAEGGSADVISVRLSLDGDVPQGTLMTRTVIGLITVTLSAV